MKNNNTLWVGLSFLVLGLVIGVLFTGGNFTEGVGGGGSDNTVADSQTPTIDPDTLEVVAVSTDDDAVKGDPDAPVTIVEFSDFQCPYCARFFTNTYPSLVEDYIDTGLVKLVYRDFPLPSHPQAEVAAIAAECVREDLGDDGYFQMHDALFERMSEWSGNEAASDVLISMANELGADVTTCMDDPAVLAEVQADYAAGRGYGVSGTPSFFINGKKLVGAYPYEIFQIVIDSEL